MASGQAGRDFQDLGIWRRAYALALQVYEVTAAFPAHAEPDVRAQLRRCAGAVGGHIADGYSRYSRDAYLRALHSARGAMMETRLFLHLARGLDYLSSEAADRLVADITRLNIQLHRTVVALRDQPSGLALPDPSQLASALDN